MVFIILFCKKKSFSGNCRINEYVYMNLNIDKTSWLFSKIALVCNVVVFFNHTDILLIKTISNTSTIGTLRVFMSYESKAMFKYGYKFNYNQF